jgi:hypothetical protein
MVNSIYLKVFLFCYSLAFFIATDIMSTLTNGGYVLVKERFILWGVTLLLIELLNQVTYKIAKRVYSLAVVIRVSVFWVLFSAAMIIYIIWLSKLDRITGNTWHSWYKYIGLYLFYIGMSVWLPYYSLIPEFRFLLLRGKFQSSESAQT